MLKWLKRLIYGRDLGEYLGETKVVKVCGIRFVIKKIDVSNHLEGFKVLLQTYSTYDDKRAAEKSSQVNLLEKLRPIYRDVFLAGVVQPSLSSKPMDGRHNVDSLFEDWVLCHQLYAEIMNFTGKKKAQFF